MTGRTRPSATPVPAAPKTDAPETPTPAPVVPEVLAGVTMPAEEVDEVKKLRAALAAAQAAAKAAKAKAKEEKAAVAAKPTARDFVRKVDLAILAAIPGLMDAAEIPEDLKAEVARLVVNQVHHLTTKERGGWPESLPTPDRSDWR